MKQLVPYKDLPSLDDRIKRIQKGMTILASHPVVDFDKFSKLKNLKNDLQKRKERQCKSK